MRIWALLSWYDENPHHLREMVESVSPLVDGIVAVDGAYGLYPGGSNNSLPDEYDAIAGACDNSGLDYVFHTPPDVWAGGEVEKRAKMFEVALTAATSREDWFLIMDGDMLLDDNSVDVEAVRHTLATTEHDVAEVIFAELAYGSSTHVVHSDGFRSLYRALPGLTVEKAHWIYTVPDETREAGRRFLWHPVGRFLAEPAADLRQHVRLLHRPHVRRSDRVRDRQAYYEAREHAGAEGIPAEWY